MASSCTAGSNMGRDIAITARLITCGGYDSQAVSLAQRRIAPVPGPTAHSRASGERERERERGTQGTVFPARRSGRTVRCSGEGPA